MLCVAVLAFAGCGGGSDDEDGGATGVSRGPEASTVSVKDGAKLTTADEVLRKKADTICRRANLRYRAGISKRLRPVILNREEGDVRTYERMVRQVVAPVLGEEIEELQTLKGTPRGEAAVDRMSAQFQKVIDEAEAHPWAFRAGPVPAAWEGQELGPELGFEDCGSIA